MDPDTNRLRVIATCNTENGETDATCDAIILTSTFTILPNLPTKGETIQIYN